MQYHIRVFCLLQRAAEGFYEMVGKLPDESYRICKKDRLLARELQFTCRRIQCGKQLVFRQYIRTCKCIQQRRFARIRISDDSSHRHLVSAALLSRNFTMALDIF